MKLVQNDITGASLLFVLFAIVIIITETWTRSRHPEPELSRKTVHFFCGIGCLFLPFFVSSPLTVLIMACVFSLFFAISEKSKLLQCLASVKRKGRGSEYYPFAVLMLFYICRERLWLYVTSILILSISDAAAAIIGSKYGKFYYKVGKEDIKSLEGSFFFWILTFQAIQIPLLLMTDLPRTSCILSALLISLLLTGIEAVSIKGTDNIFVPLLTCYGLLKITTKPVSEVAFQCVSLVCIFVLLQFVIHKLRILTIRDSIILVIFTYATWSLGSVDWSIPIFAAFFLYCAYRLFIKSDKDYQIDSASLIRVILTPLLILLAANATGKYVAFYGPYLSATIISCICGAWLYSLHTVPLKGHKRLLSVLLMGFSSSMIITGTTILFQKGFPKSAFLWITAISMAILAVYDLIIGDKFADSNKTGSLTIAIIPFSFLSALIYFAVQYMGYINYWNPKY